VARSTAGAAGSIFDTQKLPTPIMAMRTTPIMILITILRRLRGFRGMSMDFHYSRRASSGFTCAARSAGISAATVTMTINTEQLISHASGSFTFT
jgi:hypothetical protein